MLPIFEIDAFEWSTGVTLMAGLIDANGADVLDINLTESPAGEYWGSNSFTPTLGPYTFEIRQVDNTYNFNAGTKVYGPAPYDFGDASTPYYSTDDAVNLLLGPANAGIDADLNADGNPTTSANSRAQGHAEAKAKVDAALTVEGLPLPDMTNLVWSPIWAAAWGMVQFIANRYSAVALTRMRGLPLDQQGRPVDSYKMYSTEADTMLAKLIRLVQDQMAGRKADPVGVFTFIPMSNRSENWSDEHCRFIP